MTKRQRDMLEQLLIIALQVLRDGDDVNISVLVTELREIEE